MLGVLYRPWSYGQRSRTSKWVACNVLFGLLFYPYLNIISGILYNIFPAEVCFLMSTLFIPAGTESMQEKGCRNNKKSTQAHTHSLNWKRRNGAWNTNTSLTALLNNVFFLFSFSCLSKCQSQRNRQLINIHAASWKGYVQDYCCVSAVFLPSASHTLF